LRGAHAQALLERRLETIVQLVDADLKPVVLVDQRVADQHARHAGFFSAKLSSEERIAWACFNRSPPPP